MRPISIIFFLFLALNSCKVSTNRIDEQRFLTMIGTNGEVQCWEMILGFGGVPIPHDPNDSWFAGRTGVPIDCN